MRNKLGAATKRERHGALVSSLKVIQSPVEKD